MSTTQRVAITGLGAICGLGNNLDTVWNSSLQGHSSIDYIKKFEPTDLPIQFAGEVKNFTIADELLAPKEKDRYDLFIHYALHAGSEAILDSNVLNQYSPERMSCLVGCGIGGFGLTEKMVGTLIEKGARRISPFCVPGIIPNMASGLLSIKYNLKGSNFSVASACASSAHALGIAAMEIQLGRVDASLVGGAEAAITPLSIAGFAAMKALSKGELGPSQASRPFDLNRDGFVLGEGSGFLVLENYDKAVKRGARIYAELVGFGSSSDAHHITSPHPEGLGAIQAMSQAIAEAQIPSHEIAYINAHGTSTNLGDVAETKAIKKVFGEHAYKLKVSSTKSMTGHLLGAAGALESIFCVKALHHQIIPPTINLDTPDPQCDLDYTPKNSVQFSGNYALNNSFGFGGTNAALVFKRHRP